MLECTQMILQFTICPMDDRRGHITLFHTEMALDKSIETESHNIFFNVTCPSIMNSDLKQIFPFNLDHLQGDSHQTGY